MAVTTLKLAGKEFVILPKKEYAAMKARAGNTRPIRRANGPSKEDLADLREIERLKNDPSEAPVPWKEFRKRLA